MREIFFIGKRFDNGEWIKGDSLTKGKRTFIGNEDSKGNVTFIEIDPETLDVFVELPDDFPKRRLTTDKPMGNFETMMNFAYAKGDNVVLRYGARKCDIDLCEYMETVANCQFIGLEAEDYMEGACLECDSNCPFGILYTVAVQAAELRERLKMYEDLAEQALKERESGA